MGISHLSLIFPSPSQVGQAGVDVSSDNHPTPDPLICIGNNVRRIAEEDHENSAVGGSRGGDLLSLYFCEDRAGSRECEGGEEHDEDLCPALLLDFRTACGLVSEQDQDRYQQQGGCKDREENAEEDVEAAWRKKGYLFISGNNLLLSISEDGLSSSQ